jgi:hypothetical protein
MSSTLLDLLDVELTTEQKRIIIQETFDFVKGDPIAQRRARGNPRSVTPGRAKSLLEFYELVRQSIVDYETRARVPDIDKVVFTEEEPDINSSTPTVTFSLLKREPGQFGQGGPFGAKHQNLRPMLREEFTDPENPGYRVATTGYWYDNLVRFTCWSRTNKTANAKAEWFENLMEEYTWWFRLNGVSRVIFWGRDADIVVNVDQNKWYGRPIDYFVKTEKVRVFNEKTLEEILIKLKVKSQ